MPKIKITVEYDGSAYCGWQVQPNGPSVQQQLEKAVEFLTSTPTKVYGAGRTDAGVHARGQVAVFMTNSDIPPEKFAPALTTRLPKDICVRSSELVADDFDPRHDAKLKLYRYTIHACRIAPAIGRQYCWHVKWPLAIDKMKAAATKIVGEHDFTSFSNQECNAEDANNIRSVDVCDIRQDEDKLIVDVIGRSFLYNMVRNIVGTLVDVGTGKICPEDIDWIFAARDRKAAGQGAPACGLCLEWIRYA